MLLARKFAVTGFGKFQNKGYLQKDVFMHSTNLNSWHLYFSRLISYFEPLCTLNPVFGAILMRMNDIFIVGQSGAIIGRGGSYQGLSADSYHL